VLNKQRQVVYERRMKMLTGSHADIKELLDEVVAIAPTVADAIEKRIQEMGETQWYETARRLLVQVHDILWVEHLEVMQYTRSSVSLRAYGQQNPLIEYRKEGLRLFSEMQEAAVHRLAELIPNMQVEALNKEEAELRKAQEAAKRSGGARTAHTAPPRNTPVVKDATPARNEMVTITNGTDTKEMKYKKAEPLITSGEWQLRT